MSRQVVSRVNAVAGYTRPRTANAACCAGGAVATVALLCCLSVGPVVAILTAAGLGFLLSDAILIPVLVVGLGVAVWGLRLAQRIHGRSGPIVLAIVGGFLAVVGIFVAAPVAYVGIALVLGAVAWSVVALRRARGVAEPAGSA